MTAKSKFHLRHRPQRSNRRGKFRSGLEAKAAQMILKAGLGADYEVDTFPYVKQSHYTPDFRIRENVYIETKGEFSSSNRANMLAFREQHPKVEIRFLFGNADNKLYRGSKTTYGEWSEKHGFKWADIRKGLPAHWWKE
jgi:hypothetical protein